ncbi:hypothetical protein AB1Y20_017902 [Prymnesium parvum]|uniref:WW domain-containing protein n=1 Tax=Prymnesium parvum TaxID=97485 RepID=A0AB34JQD8_PRYPA
MEVTCGEASAWHGSASLHNVPFQPAAPLPPVSAESLPAAPICAPPPFFAPQALPAADDEGPEVELRLALPIEALGVLMDPRNIALLSQLQAGGPAIHVARQPSADASRAVRIRGRAAAAHSAKQVFEWCIAQAAAAKAPTRLSHVEALQRYYAPFFQRAGVPYRTPTRAWHDATEAESARLAMWASYYAAQGWADPTTYATPAIYSAPPGDAGGRGVEHGGWKEATTADGKVYFYHSETGATQWTRPAEMEAALQLPNDFSARRAENAVHCGASTAACTQMHPSSAAAGV